MTCYLLPVSESYDAVLIVGALSVGQVPCSVIRELWQVTKPGEFLGMRCREKSRHERIEI